MALLTGLAVATGLFSTLFSIAAWLASRSLFKPRRSPPAGSWPSVTILKPLKGEDRGLYENLASFCEQDYPGTLQIILCVADPGDPSLRAARRLKEGFPSLDIELVVSTRRRGSNPKISNLANAEDRIKHELLVISDSDIRVGPDFLRRAVLPFSDPATGLVSCFYRAVAAGGLGGSLEALAINAQFIPQAVTAGAFGMRFAMGAAILVRRSLFKAIGGFAALADHIADDFSLGTAIQRAGFRVEFAETAVDSVTGCWTLGDHLRHQIREFRTIRICSPYGYLGTFLLHGFSWLTLAWLFTGPEALLLPLAGILLASKAASLLMIHGSWPSCAPNAAASLRLALLPLSEWLSFACWLSGFLGSEVLWRGERYSIGPSGRLIPVR